MNILTSFQRLSSYFLALVFYKRRIARYFGTPYTTVENYYKEIVSSDFYNALRFASGLDKSFMNMTMFSVLRAPAFYVICRIVSPEVVVETGVADGFSTSFILKALERNNKGRLYSIDLPNQPGQVLENTRTTGWIVPENLRPRWELTLGSSREKLPELLNRIKKIDIFYHDSDHSFENMTFEFNYSFSYLNTDGLILADDITDNRAFDDFCVKTHSKSLKLFKTGVLRK